MKDYKELEVWKRGIMLVLATYEIAKSFPKEERYALADHIKRGGRINTVKCSGGSIKKHYQGIHSFSLYCIRFSIRIRNPNYYRQKIRLHKKRGNIDLRHYNRQKNVKCPDIIPEKYD